METLSELAERFDTDKKQSAHAYMKMYETWLANRKVDSLLEVGFGPGNSMKVWLNYFPNAKVFCMDNMGEEFEKVWHSPDTNLPGLNLIKGDSTDPATWLEVPYNLDFVVDDGSHRPEDQVATFMNGFSKLKSGGLYFLEDVHCNFDTRISETDKIFPWLNSLMINQQCKGYITEGDFYRFRGLMSWPSRDIYSFHAYKSVILFEKA